MPRIRYTSGGKEGEVLSRARALAKDPTLLLPRAPDGSLSPLFPRLLQDLKTVQGHAEEPDQLDRLTFRGEPLARAYAGLLHYAAKRPSLNHQVARFPTGDIPYLPVERVPKEELIAVQYFDDPRRLLLGYLHYARPSLFGGGGYHFYATKDSVVCTGRSADPPTSFVENALGEIPYRLTVLPGEEGWPDGTVLACSHLVRGDREPYLEVRWASARRTLRVCRRCAGEDRHLLASLSGSMVVPDPAGEFEVTVVYPLQHEHREACPAGEPPGLSRRSEKAYREGRLADQELLKEHLAEVEGSLRSHRGRLLIGGGRCFGEEVPLFVDALDPTPAERTALRRVLGRMEEPLLAPELSAGKVVEALWKDHARELLRAVGASPAEVDRFSAEGRSGGRAAETLNRVARRRAEEATVAELPRYHELSAEAHLADDLARRYRRGGAADVEHRISVADPPEGKVRGLAWAFLVALGKEQGQAWRFSDTEKEFGGSLAPSAERLLKASPEEYHAALERLLTEAGVTRWGRRLPSEEGPSEASSNPPSSPSA
jgi:hypothetical protein